jgi:predicted HicB family RNase H-like nuclease
MAEKRTGVLVRLSATLKQRLAEEAAAQGTSLNDVALGILSARFAVPFTPSGRRSTAPRSAGDVLLRMAPELKEKLTRRAAERRRFLASFATMRSSHGSSGSPVRNRPSARHALTKASCAASSASSVFRVKRYARRNALPL